VDVGSNDDADDAADDDGEVDDCNSPFCRDLIPAGCADVDGGSCGVDHLSRLLCELWTACIDCTGEDGKPFATSGISTAAEKLLAGPVSATIFSGRDRNVPLACIMLTERKLATTTNARIHGHLSLDGVGDDDSHCFATMIICHTSQHKQGLCCRSHGNLLMAVVMEPD